MAGNITSDLGSRGEQLAADFLTRNGFRLVMGNLKVPIGRNRKGVQVTGEIDLIALDNETLAFIEVKTRRSDDFAPIIANVDNRKQRQIIRTAKVYRRIFRVWDVPHRFDVVTVLLGENANPRIELVKGFWSESKFQKRRWLDDGWYEDSYVYNTWKI